MRGTYEASPTEVVQFVHGVEHLLARRGALLYSEHMLMGDLCWFGEPVPDWAAAMCQRGVNAWTWCPLLSPSLSDDGERASA